MVLQYSSQAGRERDGRHLKLEDESECHGVMDFQVKHRNGLTTYQLTYLSVLGTVLFVYVCFHVGLVCERRHDIHDNSTLYYCTT
jgi:hypothetical protein